MIVADQENSRCKFVIAMCYSSEEMGCDDVQRNIKKKKNLRQIFSLRSLFLHYTKHMKRHCDTVLVASHKILVR